MDKILRYFTENKLLVNLIIISIVISGFLSMINLKQDLYPKVELNKMIVRVIYPGASARDVEINAIVPIEKKIKEINGIKKYWSVSNENYAIIFIEIDDREKNQQKIKDDVYRELNNVPDVSKDVEKISIMDMNPDMMSVYEIGISAKEGYQATEKQLSDFVDVLEERLKNIESVSGVYKSGYRDREIKINVIPERLNYLQIPLSQIVNSIKERNVRITGGTLSSGKEDKTIVTIGQFENPLDVKDVIIRSNFDNSRIRVSDIAQIEDSFKKADIEIKINSNKGISLSIRKKANADIVKTVKDVKLFLKNIKKDLPENIELTEMYDMSSTIVTLLNVLKSNALIGFALVFLILFIFLKDLTISFWTAFTIPLTIFMTFIFMNFIGYSINIVTLAAIITVLGMLVDHGIVISDSIYEYKSKGYSPVEAVVTGIKDVIAPVSLSIITTVVAFIPMYSIKGMMGKFIYVFPTIVIFSLIASFFDASLMLPNHLIHTKLNHSPMNNKNKWFDLFANIYEKNLVKLLKHRYFVILAFVLLLILTILVSWNTIKGFVLFDDNSADLIYVSLESPKGTSLTRTSEYSKSVEDIIKSTILEKELISMKTSIGHHIIDDFDHKGYHENWGLIEIYLVPITKRKRTAQDIIDLLRQEVKNRNIKEFDKIVFQKIDMGPPTGEPVDIKIIGDDADKVKIVKKEIKEYLSKIDGVKDIDDDQKDGKEELKIDFNYSKMAKLGISVENTAYTVRTAYEGVVATTISSTKKELDFRVKIDDSYQKDISFLENLLIQSEKYGTLIKLKDIANFTIQKSLISINHYKGEKVITVTAKLEGGKNTSSQVMSLVKKDFANVDFKYPGVFLKYAGESEETGETLNDLIISFIIALLMIYFVLIMLFKSLGEPLLVMITIPFGIIGAFLAFVVHGVAFTFLGIIGIIGLMGVVVNNSIVMVDFINKIFKDKTNDKEIIPSIALGAKKRLRPVMLTTLTTVFGLLPTAYGIGGYSGMLVPITLALAYGLLFSTLLTLLFVPSLYLIRLDVINYFKSKLLPNLKALITSKK